jgi:hypothetical protein
VSCFFSDAALNWVRTLSEEIEPGDNDGLIDRKRFEPPEIYSIGLVRFIERCLLLSPEFRPDLRSMKTTIDTNIARLDRLYGAEIQKGNAEIAEDHKVYFVAEVEGWSQFDVGQKYEPPRKRRRVSIGTTTLDD